MAPTRELIPGVMAPLVTPFKKNGDVDLEANAAQVVRCAKAGMGIVLMGTNGEACHLSPEERSSIIKSSRAALDKAGLEKVALLVGTGGQSARETIQLAKEAHAAGADHSIVITPGYFAFVMGKDESAIEQFFTEVADASPLPIMIYNFPGAAAGIDLNSDLIIRLSKHQNIIGVKLTCAGIGKGHRIAVATKTEEYKKAHPTPFIVFPGFVDYLLSALVARHDGTITGTGNVIPKTIVHLYNLSRKALSSGNPADMAEAQKVQDLVAQADWTIVKAGIAGTKYALTKFCSDEAGGLDLGGYVRSPLPQTTEATKKMVDEGMKESVAFEKSLP